MWDAVVYLQLALLKSILYAAPLQYSCEQLNTVLYFLLLIKHCNQQLIKDTKHKVELLTFMYFNWHI